MILGPFHFQQLPVVQHLLLLNWLGRSQNCKVDLFRKTSPHCSRDVCHICDRLTIKLHHEGEGNEFTRLYKWKQEIQHTPAAAAGEQWTAGSSSTSVLLPCSDMDNECNQDSWAHSPALKQTHKVGLGRNKTHQEWKRGSKWSWILQEINANYKQYKFWDRKPRLFVFHSLSEPRRSCSRLGLFSLHSWRKEPQKPTGIITHTWQHSQQSSLISSSTVAYLAMLNKIQNTSRICIYMYTQAHK